MPVIDTGRSERTGHARLVIGARAYQYQHLDDGPVPTAAGAELGIDQLTAEARSASEFAAWLVSHAAKVCGDSVAFAPRRLPQGSPSLDCDSERRWTSVKITERHYAPFCQARQELLGRPRA